MPAAVVQNDEADQGDDGEDDEDEVLETKGRWQKIAEQVRWFKSRDFKIQLILNVCVWGCV